MPLVLAAAAMAQALPLLMKLETAVPWMGLFGAILMAGCGTLLISGIYMVVAEWSQRLASGSASLSIPLFEPASRCSILRPSRWLGLFSKGR